MSGAASEPGLKMQLPTRQLHASLHSYHVDSIEQDKKRVVQYTRTVTVRIIQGTIRTDRMDWKMAYSP